MNTIILKAGNDGKLCPLQPLTRQERNQARWLIRNLHCRDGMTIRQAQRTMAESGMRRSIGTLMRDLHNYECPACAT